MEKQQTNDLLKWAKIKEKNVFRHYRANFDKEKQFLRNISLEQRKHSG